jgi:Zn finger protein HypA/HybF involved in hydrogenase expression
MLEEYETAEIRSRIIVSKNNKESLLYLQRALEQRECYQTVNIYNNIDGKKTLVKQNQGEFECNILCEDCYMQHCNLSYEDDKLKPTIHCPDCNYFYNS